MVAYPYPVYDETDITAKLTLLNNKVTIDLDLSSLYVDYSYVDQVINLNFSAALDGFQEDTLTNIVYIIIYGSVVQDEIYVVDYNNFNRRTFSASSAPGSDHDINLGYTVGSEATLTDGSVYMCTDNTVGAAVWKQLDNAEAKPELDSSQTKTIVKKMPNPTVPVFLNFTVTGAGVPKGLETTSGWIYGVNDWQTMTNFVVDGDYRNIKIITKTGAGGRIRVTAGVGGKIRTLIETSGAASNSISPLTTSMGKIALRGTTICTVQGIGSGTGIFSVYLW